MASIISFTFREAVADVEYKGKIDELDDNFISKINKQMIRLQRGSVKIHCFNIIFF